MPFTPEEVTQFRTEGWVAVPDFWTLREVQAMQVELDRLKTDGKLRNVATDGDGKTTSQTKANLQLCPMFPHSDFFRAMPFAPKVAEAVAQLIGGPILLHLDQVFLKPGKSGAGTNWHQDNAYFKIADPLQGTACWTAVHAATLANGTMNVIPGSFKEQYPHTRDGDSNHHIRCWPDETRAVPVELPAGGALFFAYGTAHCTRGNTTDSERAGVALHFLTEEASRSNPDASFDQKPYLTGPQSDDGGTSAYGVRVAGTWESEVARVLTGGGTE